MLRFALRRVLIGLLFGLLLRQFSTDECVLHSEGFSIFFLLSLLRCSSLLQAQSNFQVSTSPGKFTFSVL